MHKNDYRPGVRLRGRSAINGRGEGLNSFRNSHSEARSSQMARTEFPVPLWQASCLALALAIICVGIVALDCRLPESLPEYGAPKDRFNAGRAIAHLVNLTSLGPRPAGSEANDVHAVRFLLEQIAAVTKSSKRVEVQTQRPTGAFQLSFLDGMTSWYRGIHNVIVRLQGHAKSSHSLLVNCHFDSVADSPGASDDGASCAVMLELLRVLSQEDQAVPHNIIFLFNGAEENLLQAAHGFISQHKWAKEVQAFVNLEACGAGGREILFQAGPNNPWIVQAYAEAVPYPYASTFAQEIFQSGIIPGDTDFRIFRDFGDVSGLDFAWSKNGYVYHTKLDSVSQIPPGSLQRTGDNMLALVRRLASAPQLADSAKHREGNLVFFDFLGLFMLHWPEPVGDVANALALVICIYSVVTDFKTTKYPGSTFKARVKHLLVAKIMVMISWLMAMVVAWSGAMILTIFGSNMSWFSRPVWILPLFSSLAALGLLAVPMLAASRYHRPAGGRGWALFTLYLNAVQLVWASILLVCTLLRIRSGFIAMLWVLFPSLVNLLPAHFRPKANDSQYLGVHFLVMLLPFTMTSYLILGAVNLFVPIMGRVGSSNNPDMVIAVMTSFMFCLSFSYIAPVMLVIRRSRKILTFLGAIFAVSACIVTFTPLGFPYSGDPLSPSPQRVMVMQTERTFHSLGGSVRRQDSGFWLVDMDFNSPYINTAHPQLGKALSTEPDCFTELYCGLPYLVPVTSLIRKTHWVPGPKPDISERATLKLLSRRQLEGPGSRQRLEFSMSGPDHLGLMLSPSPQCNLAGWNIPADPFLGPLWQNRKTYFVYMARGSDQNNTWNFWLNIECERASQASAGVLDLAMTSHFLHGPQKMSKELKVFVEQYPEWTTVAAWSSTYDSWRF